MGLRGMLPTFPAAASTSACASSSASDSVSSSMVVIDGVFLVDLPHRHHHDDPGLLPAIALTLTLPYLYT